MARNSHEKRAERQWLLILLPSLVLLLAFVIYPALYSVYLSFTNEALTGAAALRPRFVGFSAIIRGSSTTRSSGIRCSSPSSSSSVRRSSASSCSASISAIALRRPIRFRQMFSSIILLPNAAPEVVAGFMWISMLAGGEQCHAQPDRQSSSASRRPTGCRPSRCR